MTDEHDLRGIHYIESCAVGEEALHRISRDAVIFCGPIMRGHVIALIEEVLRLGQEVERLEQTCCDCHTTYGGTDD